MVPIFVTKRLACRDATFQTGQSVGNSIPASSDPQTPKQPINGHGQLAVPPSGSRRSEWLEGFMRSFVRSLRKEPCNWASIGPQANPGAPISAMSGKRTFTILKSVGASVAFLTPNSAFWCPRAFEGQGRPVGTVRVPVPCVASWRSPVIEMLHTRPPKPDSAVGMFCSIGRTV